jgi:hypothetical protein
MKTKIMTPHGLALTALIAAACFAWSYPSLSIAATTDAPLAVVEGIQGTVDMNQPGVHKPLKLIYGDMVNLWDTITTDAGSKLFLKWETGMLTSIGGSSSLSFGRSESANGPVNVLKMNTGVLRVTKLSGGGNVAPYMVSIPGATIAPMNFNAPVDFIVEVESPTVSAVTVIAGPVRVNNKSVTEPGGSAVSDCHTVFVSLGAGQTRVFGAESRDLDKLVNRTTIPGTIATDFACPIPTWLF